MTRLLEIQKLRARREYYDRLGKRKAALLLEAQIRSLMLRQFNEEAMRAQIDDDMDACTEVYGA